MEGIAAYQASLGVADYDVNTMATRQEMRSYVCAQCHVEYYFSKPDKRLVFPWARGLSVDSVLAYYEAMGFVDWTHGETGAPMLKAQHPEFETWSNGIHGRAGVACADCHMPYERVGAMKVSDHHVRSPLLNINKACQTCHKVDADELLDRAESIQAKTEQLSHMALDALVDLIDDIVAAQAAGRSEADLADALGYQRKASFLVDFVESENSQGFHADQESATILAESINYSRLGQVAVRR
jgi:nitrite reductase (cytochrome c-552)